MKIELESVDDVEDFLKMLSPAYLRLVQTASDGMSRMADNMDNARREDYRQRDISGVERMRDEGKISKGDADSKLAVLTAHACSTTSVGYPVKAPEVSAGQVLQDVAQAHESLVGAGVPTKDADGAPYNTDWHSDPAKLTAKAVWRARRGRDEAAYKAWLLEQAVEVAEAAIAADEAEPVATETHALPQDEPESAGDTPEVQADTETAGEAAPTVDHTALIEASQEAAKDAPDGTIDLLNAGKEFIKEYGTAKFEALKGAVCPTEDGKGKAIPSMVPAERRLMRACMDNYALYL